MRNAVVIRKKNVKQLTFIISCSRPPEISNFGDDCRLGTSDAAGVFPWTLVAVGFVCSPVTDRDLWSDPAVIAGRSVRRIVVTVRRGAGTRTSGLGLEDVSRYRDRARKTTETIGNIEATCPTELQVRLYGSNWKQDAHLTVNAQHSINQLHMDVHQDKSS